MTQTQLSQDAEVSLSYVNRIERYGWVPSRAIVLRLAEALLLDADEALLRAGFAPESIPPGQVLELIKPALQAPVVEHRLRAPEPITIPAPVLWELITTCDRMAKILQRQGIDIFGIDIFNDGISIPTERNGQYWEPADDWDDYCSARRAAEGVPA